MPKGLMVLAVLAAVAGALQWSGEARAQAPAAAEEEYVRLVTGDLLLYRREPGGRQTATPVSPSPHAVGFHSYVRDGDLYVIPLDVLPLVGRERVDDRLFNVTGLIEQGLAGRDRALPLIVQTRQELAGATTERTLESMDAVAVEQRAPRRFWEDVTSRDGTRLDGVQRIWLDGRVEGSLDTTASLIGAPRAWESGLTGEGVDVAVLDSGIDPTHPDLAGSIETTRNFTDSPDSVDRTGHGTHVAGIIAGSGETSGGTYRGIAPGADVLVGKVLADDGWGFDSWVIDGMEWAAASGAEVVNLSLGSGPTDGKDPVSLALDRLRADTGALFVVAAGNDGPAERTVSAPAAADGALAVGNATDDGFLNFFSSRGPRLGDDAIKPEIVAPGTNVVAARAALGYHGIPVDEHHTALDGTSMAAPHVAAAAAILKAAHPGWDADELESALVSSARPLAGVGAFQQGAGMLSIAGALDQRLRVDRPLLDLGVFTRPYDEPAMVVERTVGFVNDGSEPLAAVLAATVRNENGAQAALTVTPARLELDPGERATATVRLDARALEPGHYGGALTATPAGGEPTRTTLGFYKQGQTADVTVEAIDKRGRPTDAFVFIHGYRRPWGSEYSYYAFGLGAGQQRIARLPVDRYSMSALVYTYDGDRRTVEQVALDIEPQVELDTNRTVTFDARQARPLRVDTPRETDTESVTITTVRNDEPAFGGFVNATTLYPAATGIEGAVAPSASATDGFFSMFTTWDLAAPWARFDWHGPRLEPVFFSGSPRIDDRDRMRLRAFPGPVDDAIALIEESESLASDVQAAADAGAEIALVTPIWGGRATGSANGFAIPTLGIGPAEADALRDRLRRGRVELEVSGTDNSSFTYDLVFQERQRIEADMPYEVEHRELAEIEAEYHATAPGQDASFVRDMTEPCRCTLTPPLEHVKLPKERTEYVTASPVVWRDRLVGSAPFVPSLGWSLTDGARSYPARREVRARWAAGPLVPGVANATHAVRAAESMRFALPSATDTHPDHSGAFGTVTGRLLRGGEVVREFDFGVFGSVPVPASEEPYRLEVSTSRNPNSAWATTLSSETAWTFRSGAPAAGEVPLPLLDLGYDLDLGELNDAREGRSHALEIDVRRLDEPVRLRSLDLAISYDDGQTWDEERVRLERDGAEARVNHPRQNNGFAALRVRAQDTEGNTIEQTTLRAFQLR